MMMQEANTVKVMELNRFQTILSALRRSGCKITGDYATGQVKPNSVLQLYSKNLAPVERTLVKSKVKSKIENNVLNIGFTTEPGILIKIQVSTDYPPLESKRQSVTLFDVSFATH